MNPRVLASILAATLCAHLSARAQDNSWTNTGDGFWQYGTNWSAGAPSSAQYIFITNAGTKTVTIDATTAGSFPSTMTVSNITLSSVGGGVNTLFLDNAGLATPLNVLNAFTMGTGAVVHVNNSALQVDGSLDVSGVNSYNNRIIITNGGQLVTGGTAIGGLPGSGNHVLVTGPGSTWFNNGNLHVRNSSQGVVVTIADGARFVGTNVFIGQTATADGNIVLVTGTGSSWTNAGTLHVGSFHNLAQFVVSNNATAFSAHTLIGSATSPTNTLLVTGSSSRFVSTNTITVGNGSVANRLVVAAGGTVQAPTVNVENGNSVSGSGAIVGDVATAGTVAPGNSAGTLTIDGHLTMTGTASLDIELGGLVQGTDYDFLHVLTNATLDGALRLSFLNGFQATITSNDVFTILTADDSLLGAFDNVASGSRLETWDGHGSFLVTYNDGNNLVLSNFSVPEPSTACLLALGGVFLRLWRRQD